MERQNKRALRPQSSLRAPLNKVLGTETHVRAIRALDELDLPVPLPELARHIEMNKAGVWRAIAVLKELGVVEAIGIGTQQGLQLRRQYPLYRYLRDLFRTERKRFEMLLQALTDMARAIKPPPKSIWIEGPVALGRDQPGDSIVVGLLADSSNVGRLADAFSRHATSIQKQFDVAIEVRALTTADLATMRRQETYSLDDVILLSGPPPAVFEFDRSGGDQKRPARITQHRQREDESLLVARLLAEKIRRDPTLVRRASRFLRSRLASASPREAKELHEWRRVLQTYSTPRLLKLMTDSSERGVRLRQSSPFVPALSPSERRELVRAVGRAAERPATE